MNPPLPTAELLPLVAEGHWVTSGGHAIATEYLGKQRADLMMGNLSDLEMANAIFMADRNSLDLIAYQAAAKERIRWLSAQLAAWNTRPVAPPSGETSDLVETLTTIANWRSDSRAYTDSMNLPPRPMDEAQIIHIETLARAAIARLQEAPAPVAPDMEAVEELAQTLDVSPAEVRRALDNLLSRGLIAKAGRSSS